MAHFFGRGPKYEEEERRDISGIQLRVLTGGIFGENFFDTLKNQ